MIFTVEIGLELELLKFDFLNFLELEVVSQVNRVKIALI